jgi:tetratricopeptide (TPR) repeat protein
MESGMDPDWTDEEILRVAQCGYELYREGRYREAGVIFEGLVGLRPGDAYCRESLAVLYLLLEDPQAAIEQLNELLARDPNHAGARARRCEAWWRLGRAAQARSDFDRFALSATPAQAARLRLLLENPAMPAAMSQLPPGAER